ncbi:MAG: hypothetical protein PHQ42_05440 [Patescibacteria group bacterium]|nr:hypothetical protein [Patescibacteria group bacterium]
MPKFLKFSLFGLSLLIIFTLTGCGQKSAAPGSSGNSSDSSRATEQNGLLNGSASANNEAGQIFEQTVEVELPDSPAMKTESEIRPLLKKIFGDVKAESYQADIMGAGSLIVSYATSRLPTPNDLGAITKAMKEKGYKVTMENNSNVQAVAMFTAKPYDVNINFDTKHPTIGVQYNPHFEAPQY